ncbi:hypothetical protein COHA_005113 [Chlorella ohadii]|uniref:UspA domain-containing protein n=1 Tax=Chlorella ohadii TaxID=2649997 RepID=A0AAD5H5M8_9CHLO|nr:hypothetical protein COHA_005113 [Chlorella ohadii]
MCTEAFAGQEVAHVVDVIREEPLGPGEKGRVAQALCRKAEELEAAVVVVASQRKSGISEFLLGSVAAHCAQHSSRPVLVVHAPQPGGSGAAGPEASEKACSWAVEHLRRPGDTFHLLRIIPLLPYRAAYGGPVLDGIVFYQPLEVTDSFKAATERYMQHRFEPKLKEAGISYEVEVLVEATDESVSGVGDSICKRAEELGAAAVVMGSHMSGGLMQFMLGSVASYVAHHCKQPVAVLH